MAIDLTTAAAKAVHDAIAKNGLGAGYGLRLSKAGAGWSLDLEEGPGAADRVSESQGVSVFCDKKTYLLVGDVRIDYRASDGGFVIQR